MAFTSFRVTTNGTLRNYRSNLNTSRKALNDSMEKVLTHRQFNSYAEDPASASQAFKIRRSLWRNHAQLTNNQSLLSSYDVAFSAVDEICDDTPETEGLTTVLHGIEEAIRGTTDTTAGARVALAKSLNGKAESIMKLMNVQYGDNYVFAGTDGKNPPFSWGENGELLYRGIDVNSETAIKQLDEMAGETAYMDIGLGFREIEDNEILSNSAFNGVLSGLNVLGYGQDEDGDSKNIVTLMKEMADIFSRCDADNGDYATDEDRERASVLLDKIGDAVDRVSQQHVQITSDANYLKTNLKQLNATKDTMNEQLDSVETIDPVDAIMAMSWAQYSYNAALKIGNGILSQSLLDYMN